jgi:hypothetical protein
LACGNHRRYFCDPVRRQKLMIACAPSPDLAPEGQVRLDSDDLAGRRQVVNPRVDDELVIADAFHNHRMNSVFA